MQNFNLGFNLGITIFWMLAFYIFWLRSNARKIS